MLSTHRSMISTVGGVYITQGFGVVNCTTGKMAGYAVQQTVSCLSLMHLMTSLLYVYGFVRSAEHVAL